MLIKRGDAEIIDVIKDDEHKLDDEGTRKALKLAEEKAKALENAKEIPSVKEGNPKGN